MRMFLIVSFLLLQACATTNPTYESLVGEWEASGPPHMQLQITEDKRGLFGMGGEDAFTCAISAIKGQDQEVSLDLDCPEKDGDRLLSIQLNATFIGMAVSSAAFLEDDEISVVKVGDEELPWSIVFVDQQRLESDRASLKQLMEDSIESTEVISEIYFESNSVVSDDESAEIVSTED